MDETNHITDSALSLRWQDGGDHIVFHPPSPYRHSETLVYLGRSTNECLHTIVDGVVYKCLRFDQEPVLLEIAGAGNTVTVRFPLGVPSRDVRASVAAYVWDWFDFGMDLSPFYRIAREDSVLSALVQRYEGLRVIGVPDLFEALSWAVIGQQINLAFAYTLKRRFVEAYGESVTWESRTFWRFPDAAAVAGLSPEALLSMKFSWRKAEYLLEVVRQIACGTLSKAELRAMSAERALKRLTSIRGIGPWSANYVLMRCLRWPGAFPIEDAGLHQALRKQLGLSRKPTYDEIRQLAVPWQGWEAYATFYLWRSLHD